ncbi:oligosaccharide flippase family protein [Legionella lansingensis]|nr:oligosaccharide flippase family protein [Legionella lansingensis]
MSLSSKSFKVLIREILLFFSNLVTSLIVARTLGPYLSGLWIILALIPSYAEMLFRIKSDAAAIFYLGKGGYELGDVVFMLNSIAVVTSAMLIIPIIIWFDVFKEALFGANVGDLNVLIYIMLMQIPINFLYMNYTYLHIHKEDVKSLNAMVATRAIVSSGAIIAMLLIFNTGLVGVVVGSTIGLLCALIIGVFRLGIIPRIGRRFNLSLLKDLLKYGSKLYVANIATHLNLYSSQAIVVAFCQPAQVAFFSIAQQIGQLINKITDSMGTFLFPSISKQSNEQSAAELSALAFRVSIVILIPGAVILAAIMRPAIIFCYGAAYEPVLIPFFIILPGFVLAASATTLMLFFQGIGRADLVAKIAVVPLFIQVVTALMLVPKWTVIGGAVSLLLTLIITAIVEILVFIKLAGLSWNDLVVQWRDIQLVKEFIFNTIQRVVPRAAGRRI